jgi:hypothetical protein
MGTTGLVGPQPVKPIATNVTKRTRGRTIQQLLFQSILFNDTIADARPAST